MVNAERLNPELMIQPNEIADVIEFVLSTSKKICPTEITVQPQRSPWKQSDQHL